MRYLFTDRVLPTVDDGGHIISLEKQQENQCRINKQFTAVDVDSSGRHY